MATEATAHNVILYVQCRIELSANIIVERVTFCF